MSKSKHSIQNLIIYTVVAVFFLYLAIAYPVGIYGDSEQFISMHMHREPLYPLFIALFRVLFPTDIYLKVTIIGQNILNAVATIYLLSFFFREYEMKTWMKSLAALFTLLPHVMTPLFSQTGIVLTCGIMNEAIAFPLFYFYMVSLINLAINGKKKHAIIACIFAFLLSLTRGSLMICIIAWMMVFTGRLIFEKKKWYFLVMPVIVMAVLFPTRGKLYEGYNYLVNGISEANMCGNMNLVTNILYASDREVGGQIEDETARQLFYEIYDRADADGLNYRYAGNGWYDRIKHLENTHDNLKFNYILQVEQDYYEANYGTDYVERNKFQEEECRLIAHSIIGSCIGRWLFQYLGLSINGLVRSIAVVRPYTVIPFMILGITSFVLCIVCFVRKKHVKEALALTITLVLLAANAFGTATVIMCISRYMIYCFALYYITLMNLVMKCFSERNRNEL